MRIVLVNSPPYQIQEAMYDTPPFPRTALAFLAGYLRHHGVDVHVIDSKYSRLDYDATLDKIKEINPDIVGLTALTNEVIQAAKVAGMVKSWRPDVKTLIGGVHASVLPERTLREFTDFDYAIVGEGETPLLEFVQACESGKEAALEKIAGVATLTADGSYHYGGDSPVISDMNELPAPAWDMFKHAEEYMLHTARGCPYHCPFCANFNGRKVREKNADAVLDEIETLVNKGTKSIIFGDEVFTVNRERTVEFCRGMIARGLHKRMKWWCVTHIRCIDYDLAVLLKEAGCNMVGLGIESGNNERLAEINKGTTAEMILDVTSQIKRAKLPFEAYLILGYPNETLQSAKETVNFIVKVNPDQPVIGLMVPYPGTKIAEIAERGEGGYVLQARDWNDYNKQLGDALAFKNITRKELEKIQLMGYIRVFLCNHRYVDFAKFLWRYRLLAWKAFLKIASFQSRRAEPA
jgi:anaerobic magnesium-protoporphyrin IX monomethyl ester cyclase